MPDPGDGFGGARGAGGHEQPSRGSSYLDDLEEEALAEAEAARQEDGGDQGEWDFLEAYNKADHEYTWDEIRDTISNTKLLDDRAGLKSALDLFGIEMRYNLRSAELEWCFDKTEFPQLWGRSGWHITSDRFEAAIRGQIETHFRFEDGKRARWSNAAWQNSRDDLALWCEEDPFLEWAKALEWDGQPRLDRWLTELFVLEDGQDQDLVAWASRQPLIGACKRASFPGAKMDQMVVLCGPQGAGKSTALRCLMPPERQDQWFSDTFDFSVDGKERVESILGTVLVEVGEMAGSTRQEAARIKQDMARMVDRVRLAYRRNADVIPRRHVRVGTTNVKGDLPNDPTGLRRFVPVDISDIRVANVAAIEEWMDDHREQLWAEAWARRSEPVYTDSDRLTKAARQAAESHRYADELLEAAAEAFLEEHPEPFALKDFQAYLRDKVDGRDVHVTQPTMKRALMNLGCSYKVISGKRMYVPPAEESAEQPVAGDGSEPDGGQISVSGPVEPF